MIELPLRLTTGIYHSSSKEYLDTILLNVLSAGGINRKESRQACSFSASHLQQRNAIPDQKNWEPQIFPYVHHKWDMDTVCTIDLVKTQDMGQQFYKTQFFCCSCWIRSSRMYCKSRRTRSNGLVRKTITSRTARTGNPRPLPCIG